MAGWIGVRTLLLLSALAPLSAGCSGPEERVAGLRAAGGAPCYLGEETVPCHPRQPVEGLTPAGLRQSYAAEPWLKFDGKDRPATGLALMGGGAQAGSFSLGVLKRLVDEDLLRDIDVLSVVSGGGYAALYLYTSADALMPPGTTPDGGADGAAAVLRGNFTLPYAYCLGPARTEKAPGQEEKESVHVPVLSTDGLLATGRLDSLIYSKSYCPANRNRVADSGVPDGPLNTVQRRSDVFSNDSTRPSRAEQGFDIPRAGWELTRTLATAPAYWATNLLFDTGLEVSPSKWLYRDGILRAYGSCPENTAGPQPGEPDGARNCLQPSGPDSPLYGLRFSHLRRLADHSAPDRRLPVLVLNATIPTRPVWDMRKSDVTRMDDHRFEITPFGFGNHQYGFADASPDRLGIAVGDGVGAAAAFIDPAQRVFSTGQNAFIAAATNLFNVDWSVSLPNYRLTPPQRIVAAAVPAPLHLFSRLNEPELRSHIHLGDGGVSRDTFGLLALLERGTRTIFISDHVDDRYDDRGSLRFEALCNAATFLSDRGYRLIFDGHPTTPLPGAGTPLAGAGTPEPEIDIARHCSGETPTLKSAPDGGSYSFRDWQRPLWKGTVRTARDPADIRPGTTGLLDGTTLYLMKTAIPGHSRTMDAIRHCAGSLKTLLESGHPVPQRDLARACPLLDMAEAARRIRAGEPPLFPPLITAWLLDGGTTPNGKGLDSSLFPQDSMFTMTAFNSQNIFAVYLELGNYLAYAMAQQIRQSRPPAGR